MIRYFYLVVSERGSMRVLKSVPALNWDEIAIKMKLDIPDEIFKRPQLSASIKIPKDVVLTKVIEADIVDNIKEIFKAGTDLNINLTIVDSEDKEDGK